MDTTDEMRSAARDVYYLAAELNKAVDKTAALGLFVEVNTLMHTSASSGVLRSHPMVSYRVSNQETL